MSNTLDDVLVKYRGRTTSNYVSENHRRIEEKKISIPEFLKIPNKDLKAMEVRVKKALTFIYQQNDKDPPLFLKFDNWRPDQPLTIDCLNLPKKQSKHTIAFYAPNDNLICFEQTKRTIDLIETISHELKHAEQFSKECFDLKEEYSKKNGIKWQKLEFLEEAQSYIFGVYVSMLQYGKGKVSKDKIEKSLRKGFYKGIKNEKGEYLPGLKYLLKEHPDVRKWDYRKMEEKLLPAFYTTLRLESPYKKDYDCVMPTKKADLEDTNVRIPESFHITGKTEYMDDLTYTKATTPYGRLKQLCEDPTDVMTEEDQKLIERKRKNKKDDNEYLLDSAAEKKERKSHRYYSLFSNREYYSRKFCYMDYLCAHEKKDHAIELFSQRNFFDKDERKGYIKNYFDKLEKDMWKIEKKDRRYSREDMTLIEKQDKNGKWFLDENDQSSYLLYLYNFGQEVHAWDLFKNASMDSKAKGNFIYKYIEKKNEENGEIPPEQMTLIESKDKEGNYLLKEYSGLPTSEYTKYLLSHGLENYAIRLFKQHKCDDAHFICAYYYSKEEENRPFLPEEMALVESKRKNGEYIAIDDIRRKYIDHLWTHGQKEHVFELLNEKAFWEYKEKDSPPKFLDKELYLSEFLHKKCQEDRPFTQTEMKLFEEKRYSYILNNEDQQLYINHLITYNPNQWQHAADLIFNKKFFDLYGSKQNYWRKQVFLSKYLDYKMEENKPLTEQEMRFFEIKLKSMEPASYEEKYSEKDNFEANFKDDYFMHPMLRQKYIQFLVDHGQEKRAYRLSASEFDQKDYYNNKSSLKNETGAINKIINRRGR